MFKLKLDKNNYIIGSGAFGNKRYPQYEWEMPEEITDALNQPLYWWDGEKPVYKPMGFTTEQTEQLRKEWVRDEIRKTYSIDDELKLMRKKDKDKIKFDAYDEDIERIITDSLNKDFQVK